MYVPIWKFVDTFVFEIFGHKMHLVGVSGNAIWVTSGPYREQVQQFQMLSNLCCHGNHVVPHSLGGRPYVSHGV